MVFVYIKVFNLATSPTQTLKWVSPSGDMQYMPSVYLWVKGLNPFAEYLNGDNLVAPNYMHLLYILMYPLTFFEWESVKKIWAILSLLCFIASVALFFKRYKNAEFLMVLSFLSFLANGFPTVIAVGQYAGVLSLALSIAYLYRRNFIICGICLSIIFIKYSFGVPILLAFFLAGYRKEVLLALFIHFLAILFFYFRFDSDLLEIALQPLKVASSATGRGPADLLSFFRGINEGNILSQMGLMLTLAFIFLLYSLYIFKNKKYLLDSNIIASGVVLSLGTLFHLGYDNYVFLIAFFILKDNLNFFTKPFLFLFCIVFILWFSQRFGAYSGLNKFFLNHYGIEITWGGPMPIAYTFTPSTLTILSSLYILYSTKKEK